MLKGFFDDSGTHDGSLVTVVGGCVARGEQWQAFTRPRADAPKVEGSRVFHSADLANSRGEFNGWDDIKKRRLIRSLASVMQGYAKKAIAGVIVVEDYETAVPEWARQTAAFGDKYNFCFQMCVGLTMSWIECLNPPMPENGQIAFFFDGQPKREGNTKIPTTR